MDEAGREKLTEIDEAEIDDGILGAVRVLRAGGIETFSSCQGGGRAYGHGFELPTISFSGDDAEGERAERIAAEAGYQVREVRRVWYTRDVERYGPFWQLIFVMGAACRAPVDRDITSALATIEAQGQKIERLECNLVARDHFIVEHDLWGEFTKSCEANQAAALSKLAEQGKEIERLKGDLDWVNHGEARKQLTSAHARIAELEGALGGMVEPCLHANPGAFNNGVTDSTGTIDEGDIIAGNTIDHARAVLSEPKKEG